MIEFIVECKVLSTRVSVVLDTTDFHEAFFEATCKDVIGLSAFPITITEMDWVSHRTAIGFCPNCPYVVFRDDEWILTDKVNQYQHVDCRNPDRFPAVPSA